MFERLRRAIVESFVGAIALGWLLAQGIVHFVGVFTAPVASWTMRSKFPDFIRSKVDPAGFALQEALFELLRSFLLLLVWYVLLRWLYYKPLRNETSEPELPPEQSA